MLNKVHQNPDGSITFNSERYRVEERGQDEYDVVRERDGQRVGAFRLLPDVRIEAEGEHQEIVEAVAGVLASPRGAVPLQ